MWAHRQLNEYELTTAPPHCQCHASLILLPCPSLLPSPLPPSLPQAHDKYFKVEVIVQAPVLLLPISEQSDQGFMVDLGSVAIQNTLIVPDQSQVRVGIDAYGIKLDSFKVSR